MKKIILFICTGIIVSATLPSCNKSYTCECVNTYGVKKTQTVIGINKTEAQKDCNEYGLEGYCDIKE